MSHKQLKLNQPNLVEIFSSSIAWHIEKLSKEIALRHECILFIDWEYFKEEITNNIYNNKIREKK